MKKAFILAMVVLVVVACQQQTVDTLETPQEASKPSPQPLVQEPEPPKESAPEEQTIIVDGEIQQRPEVEAPTPIPEGDLQSLTCLKLQNMTSTSPDAIGENAALTLSVGTDGTSKGIYDLGYLIPSGLFRIGRQGIKTAVPVSIKLRGPGSIQSQPMDLTFQCDNQTYYTSLPAMNADTIFYVDTYGRLYWRDTDHDGTGVTMDAERALAPEHRLMQ